MGAKCGSATLFARPVLTLNYTHNVEKALVMIRMLIVSHFMTKKVICFLQS